SIKRNLGQKVETQGVRFKDLYEQKALKVQSIYKSYNEEIKEFDKKIKQAAKKDGTDEKTVEWLIKWNEHYGELAKGLNASAVQFLAAVDKLGEKLGKK
ncbi:10743_t:CDS:1, partial [Dentiscutata heterogama]